jgi:hypothetical protein
MTRLSTLSAIAAGLAGVLLAASPAAANPVVPVRPGDTYSALVARHCAPGTSWQALDFGGRNKNLTCGARVELRRRRPSHGVGSLRLTPASCPASACGGDAYMRAWTWLRSTEHPSERLLRGRCRRVGSPVVPAIT